jgi:hypothetical protein
MQRSSNPAICTSPVKGELHIALKEASKSRRKGFNNENRKTVARHLVAFLSEYIETSKACYLDDRNDLLRQAQAKLVPVANRRKHQTILEGVAAKLRESKEIDDAFGLARSFQEAYESSNPEALSIAPDKPEKRDSHRRARNRADVEEFSDLLDWGMANYDVEKWKDILGRVKGQTGLRAPDMDALEKLIGCSKVHSTKPVPAQDSAMFELPGGGLQIEQIRAQTMSQDPAPLEPPGGWSKGSAHLDSGSAVQPDEGLVHHGDPRRPIETSEPPFNTDAIQTQIEEALGKALDTAQVTRPQPDSTIAKCPSWIRGNTVQPEGSSE